MIKLYFLAMWHVSRFVGRFLIQFPMVQAFFLAYFKFVGWALLFVLIAAIFWKVLPFVALGFMAWHIYRWRHREAW